MTDFHILIPRGVAATRLPNKPLVKMAGRALVLRVLDCALKAGAQSVHVATDSDLVAALIESEGGRVVKTSSTHRSGTDRLAEAAERLGLPDDAIVVNLQGDEPEMPAACLRQVAQLLAASPGAQMATLYRAADSEDEWLDPNLVKLVAADNGAALYSSRSPVPHARDGGWPRLQARIHLGLYAYRAGALAEWRNLPEAMLERLESLEQLRALAAGWTIVCDRAAENVPAGIDTPQDVKRAEARLNKA